MIQITDSPKNFNDNIYVKKGYTNQYKANKRKERIEEVFLIKKKGTLSNQSKDMNQGIFPSS